ncbi:MAG: thioesterase family protein [Phycisphaeraceae bacterium]
MIEEITVETRVRYAECDAQRVAHHSVFPVWMEMARTELLRANGVSYRECEDSGVYFVVVRLSISYRRPAVYDDMLSIDVKTTNVGRVKLEHEYVFKRGDEVLATAATTLACVDRLGRPMAMPEGFLKGSARL